MKNLIIWFFKGIILVIVLFYGGLFIYKKLVEISHEFFGFFSPALFGKTLWFIDFAVFLCTVTFIGFLTDAHLIKNKISPFISPFLKKILKSIPVFGELFSRKPFLAPYWGVIDPKLAPRHTASISSIVKKRNGNYLITVAFWHIPPLMLQFPEETEVEIGISFDQALSFSFGGGITLENAKSELGTQTITIGEFIRREGYVNIIQPAS